MGLILFLPTVLGIASAFGLALLSRSRSALSGDHVVITKVFRRLIGWRIGGFVVGIALAIAIPFVALGLLGIDSPEVILVWAPVALALVYLLSLLIGEHVAYRPAAGQHGANLAARVASRYITVRGVIVPLVASLGFFALAVATLALTNDRGSVMITCASPYPNDYGASSHSTIERSTSWACLGSIATAAILTALVARAATNRARPDTHVFAAAEDDALRRSTIRAAVGIYTSFAAILGAVFTLVLAEVLTSDFEPCGAPSWWNPIGVALWWSLIAWFAVYTWGVVQIVSRPIATRMSATIG
ncbi:hypothetical protein [Gordonia sp. CPCC 205333]|uniref:hypothetical protein n=1 Tax=Gordonia sp. CPCC 205333 TaxID=3140790 RepID=UPI003AF3E5DC